PRISATVAFENEAGLPLVYNHAIDRESDTDVLVFMHDDVWIDDYFFTERVLSGLGQFDVIGLAGHRQRRPGQKGWCFLSDPNTHDDPKFLSGRIAQANHPCGVIYYWGAVPAKCDLLDGVLLAVRKKTLRDSDVRFDAQFKFHFYDMDFCRTAADRGLRLGTWPICVTHESGGNFANDSWQAASARYLQKWRD
ncbi:MAG TPA: glycosyltransferase, partial [Usitatibacter sp.]|nr:glycosyltransferase [Usitatibacter sp.]